MRLLIFLLLGAVLAGCTQGPGGEINDVSDLKGKTLAVPGFATVQYFLALRALDQANLSEGDVNFVATGSPSQMELKLASGDIDGFVAWEPYNTKTVEEGTGRVLVQSGDILPDHPCCVMATRSTYLSDNPEVAWAMVRAHIRATNFINQHPDEAAVIFARATGYDLAVVKAAMKNIVYTYNPSFEGTKDYVDFLLEKGKIEDGKVASSDSFLEDFWDTELLDHSNGSPVHATVRVGYLQNDLHQLTFWVAKEKGYYADEGITVDEKVYQNGGYEMDGFAAGEIDMGYLGTAPAVLKKANAGIDIKALAQVNNEGSAIVVR